MKWTERETFWVKKILTHESKQTTDLLPTYIFSKYKQTSYRSTTSLETLEIAEYYTPAESKGLLPEDRNDIGEEE